MRCIFRQRNVDKTNRNGEVPDTKTIVKYVTQTGPQGIDGADSYQVILSPNVHTFQGNAISALNGQSDKVNVFVFRGATQINARILSGIEGERDGISVAIDGSSNGTIGAFFTVNVTSDLREDSGRLIIPIEYNMTVLDASTTYDASLWNDSSNYNYGTFNAVYSWNVAKSSESMYRLDLSNETASINADADGNILGRAIRPSCKATLNFGSDAVPDTSVSYGISYPANYGVQGVSIDPSTGVLSFNDSSTNPPFRFGEPNNPDDTILEITVDASVLNVNDEWEIKGTKTMTITKALPGQMGPQGATGPQGETGPQGATGPQGETGPQGDVGDAAVSYWLDFSADAIRIDSSTIAHPSSITATAYKQVGEQDPSTATECVIKWGYNTLNPTTQTSSYTYTISDVSTGAQYITFKLYKDGGSTFLGETETIPILRDGKEGEQGGIGPRGAIMRGPYYWDSAENKNITGLAPRRFCSGKPDEYNVQDASYIDTIIHDSSYYYCKTSYDSGANDAWNDVKSKWQAADVGYDFVAAQLLLANNAKIKFLSGNEFYLTDPSGNVHGGGRAKDANSDIIFWAGSDSSTANIDNAPFQVDYQGNLKAKSGTFAGYVQYPYTSILELDKTTSIGDSSCFVADHRANIVSMPDASYESDTRYLKLPAPSENLNGFTYTILIQPTTATRGSGEAYLPAGVKIFAADNSSIWCYAYPKLMRCEKWYFECGYLVLTCIPYSDGYMWAITQATGIMEYYGGSHEYSSGTHKDYYDTYHVSSVLGTSRDRDVSIGGAIDPSKHTSVDMIYNIWTYTDNDAPSLNNANVMYVKK